MSQNETAMLSADQAHRQIGGSKVISRASFYLGLHNGEIPCVRIGRRFLIPRSAFMAWLNDTRRNAAKELPRRRKTA